MMILDGRDRPHELSPLGHEIEGGEEVVSNGDRHGAIVLHRHGSADPDDPHAPIEDQLELNGRLRLNGTGWRGGTRPGLESISHTSNRMDEARLESRFPEFEPQAGNVSLDSMWSRKEVGTSQFVLDSASAEHVTRVARQQAQEVEFRAG